MADVLNLLGLAYRAGKLVFGEDTLNRMNKLNFLFIASDSSSKTIERYLKKVEYYDLPYSIAYDHTELSRALGKDNIHIVGIADRGFGQSIIKKIKEGSDG